MRKFIVFITVLLTIASCSQQETKSPIEQRIQNIENGLVEFTPQMACFK
jgi:hypothetical protein